MYILIRAICYFAEFLEVLLIARAILSWFPANTGILYKIYEFVYKLTEPMLIPFRKLLSRFNTGMFDFSVLLAFIAIVIAERICVKLVAIIYSAAIHAVLNMIMMCNI